MSDENKEKKSNVHWFFIGLGIAVLILGVFLFSSNQKFMETAVETTAVVTEIKIEYNGANEEERRVIVEFYADGVRYELTLKDSSRVGKVGESVQIYYDPANPHNFESASHGKTSFIVCMLLGTGFLAFGILQPFIARRKQNNNK